MTRSHTGSGDALRTTVDSAVQDVVLEQMDDGVIVVAFGGTVATVNAAAARILGAHVADMVGRPFAELLVSNPGIDPFTELMLDAVSNERASERRTVAIEVEGEPRLLSVSTTYLRTGDGTDRRRSGIIAVFADITAAEMLRESELRLGRQVREQYEELQTAYRSVEENNEKLQAALRRVRVVQGVAAAAVLAVFALAGGFAWTAGSSVVGDADATVARPAAADAATLAIAVMPERLRRAVGVTGQLTPREEVGVLSPVDATVRAAFVKYGDEVERGQDLVALDLSKVRQEYRAQRATYIKAEQRVRELDRWEEGPAVTAARRSLTRASNALEKQRHRIAETAFLLERGVIPASEHRAAEEHYEHLQSDHEVAEQALAAARAQGGAEAREVARLEFENLRDRIEALEAAMATDVLRAPVAGVVLQPTTPEAALGGGLTTGKSVSAGDLIVAVADISALAVEAKVDELDVADVRVGQRATVTSDAAPGLELEAVVANVSSQALPARRGSQALFAVTLALDEMDEHGRRRLKLGMSVDARIVTLDRADALLVPIAAVALEGERALVRIRDPHTGEARAVEVETGATTLDRVEITRGLAAGDRILVPESR